MKQFHEPSIVSKERVLLLEEVRYSLAHPAGNSFLLGGKLQQPHVIFEMLSDSYRAVKTELTPKF